LKKFQITGLESWTKRKYKYIMFLTEEKLDNTGTQLEACPKKPFAS
jgi:hypothetical protein